MRYSMILSFYERRLWDFNICKHQMTELNVQQSNKEFNYAILQLNFALNQILHYITIA